ncbi:hypothetical protein BJ138DRAFT_1119038 [Hygrophoropsis aurantiaca]|uniref:Uncharacterized protein n=1 Tax=Hygrophoropsis aurantiaca TaxID=72124 RepID=A0ACB7ZWV7_9AGAM|nr:hypothetical protein BJ138DRAFT_1119038 [Hygrophoropsis aurantiaca]
MDGTLERVGAAPNTTGEQSEGVPASNYTTRVVTNATFSASTSTKFLANTIRVEKKSQNPLTCTIHQFHMTLKVAGIHLTYAQGRQLGSFVKGEP